MSTNAIVLRAVYVLQKYFEYQIAKATYNLIYFKFLYDVRGSREM